jgi:cytoskeletal protein RodZ
MAVFDRFRRSRQQSVLPDEVRNYYQAEQRQRRGVAVLFALIGIIITVIIAGALFLAGRALYRSLNDSESSNAGQGGQTSSDATNRPSADSNSGDSEVKPQPSANPSTNPNPTPQPAPATNPGTATPQQNATPALGDDQNTLPHTGDEGL